MLDINPERYSSIGSADESRIVSVSARPQVVAYFNGTFIHMRNGAHARMASLLRYLVDSGFSVTLFSFEDHPTEPWTPAAQDAFRRAFPTVRLVLDRRTAALSRLTTLKNAVTSFFPGKASKVTAWRQPGASPNYEALLAEIPGAVWIVNYANALTELNGLPPGPVVVETHDIKFINVAKKAGGETPKLHSILKQRSLLRMRSEISVLNCAAGVVAISPVEAGFFRTLLPGPYTFYIPQYGSVAPRRAERPREGYQHDLLFVGSDMFHNVEGLSRFLTANGHWMTSLRIAIAGTVGTNPQVRAAAQNWRNVQILGFVDDIAAVYAASKATISPVDGTGLKIKAVESLSYGRPVFASRHAIDGLAPGHGGCVFPIERTQIERLLFDEAKLEVAQASALTYWEGMAHAGDIVSLQNFLERAPLARQPAG